MIGGVYIGYPIDQRGPASLVYMFDQIEKIKRALIENGLAEWIFDPGDAFMVNGRPQDDSVARINRCAHIQADLILAFLPAGVPTIGVPMEIDRGLSQGKHVLVFSDTDSYMLRMPRMVRFPGWEDEDLNLAMEYIAELDPPVFTKQYNDLPFKVGPEGALPTRHYEDDAGLDLYVSEDTTIPQGAFRDVPCDVRVELPDHTWGLVTGRSSALRTHGLLVHSGVIDAGYRGELFAGAYALNHDVELKKGDRVAQLIVLNNATKYLTPIRSEELRPSPRGERGFGSTGA